MRVITFSLILLSFIFIMSSPLHAENYDLEKYDFGPPTLYFGTNTAIIDQTGTMLHGNNPDCANPIPGAIIQLIKDGGDNVISPPDASGDKTGDDIIVLTTTIGTGNPNLFGEGEKEKGTFSVYCNFSSYEDKLYARIFNTSDLATATYYGQSLLVQLNDLPGFTDRTFNVDAYGLTRTDIPLDPTGDYVATAHIADPHFDNEGTPIMLDASGTTDPDTDVNSLVYIWDLDDDGEFDDATGITTNYAWGDNGVFDISVKASNPISGTASIASSSVTIYNAPPEIVEPSDQTAQVSSQYTVSTSYSDSGFADTHTVDVSWGDLSTELNIAVSNGVISLSHTYTGADTYTVEITLYDDDGASTSTSFPVTVNNSAPETVIIVPDISLTNGIHLSWDAQTGYQYEVWFADTTLSNFDVTANAWCLADVVTANSYTDTGDEDGYDNTSDTNDDRVHPSQVTARFYVVRGVAD